MSVKLHIPYYDYNDNSFDVDNSFYQTEDDYVRALNEAYNSTKDTIFEMMSTGNVSHANTYKFSPKTPSSKEKIAYTTCDATIYDENGEKVGLEMLLKAFREQDVCMYVLQFDSDTMEEKFEGELKSWASETNNIMMQDRSDDWIFKAKPTLNISFSLKNNANETVYGRLVNCRLEEILEYNEYLIIAEKVEFIKSLE